MSRFAAILIGIAVFLSMARLGALLFVPMMASDIPTALVLARPTGEVIALSASSGSASSAFLVGIVAISSRLALDMTTFYAARYGMDFCPRSWKKRVFLLRRKLPTRWVLPLAVIYSPAPVMLLLGVCQVTAHRVLLALAAGNSIIVVLYIAASRIWSAQLQLLSQFITEYKTESILAIIGIIGGSAMLKNRSILYDVVWRRLRGVGREPS